MRLRFGFIIKTFFKLNQNIIKLANTVDISIHFNFL